MLASPLAFFASPRFLPLVPSDWWFARDVLVPIGARFTTFFDSRRQIEALWTETNAYCFARG